MNNKSVPDVSHDAEKSRKSKLKDKIFMERKSLIQEMYDVIHIRNIHYFFMMFLLTYFINHVTYGYLQEGRFSLHINVIQENFSDWRLAIQGWMFIFMATLLVYPVFKFGSFMKNLIATDIMPQLFLIMCILSGLLYYYKLFSWTGKFCISHNLSFTSTFFLTVEVSRLLMKTHAFIRSNVVRVINGKNNFETDSFLHYFEFLFMPTLVYRNSYPRTKSINWLNVLKYTSELCGCVFFICYIYNMYFADDCAYLKVTTGYHRKDIAWLIFKNTIPSFAVIMIMFYFILHLLQNLFGELTRFADRLFYQDWWNSTSYDEYYRKWNIVVHDWLYNYLYKDILYIFGLKSTLIPKSIVFLTSAVVHEYIMYYSTRMMYPVLGTMFFSMAMLFTSFRSPRYWLINVLFLYGFGFGFSINMTTYIMEYCVRQNPCALKSHKYPFEWMYSKTFFNDCII